MKLRSEVRFTPHQDVRLVIARVTSQVFLTLGKRNQDPELLNKTLFL